MQSSTSFAALHGLLGNRPNDLLAPVIERINLLCHTHSVCEAEFAALAEFNGFDATTFSFADLRPFWSG